MARNPASKHKLGKFIPGAFAAFADSHLSAPFGLLRVAAIAFCLIGCQREVQEHVPQIEPIRDAPELLKYLAVNGSSTKSNLTPPLRVVSEIRGSVDTVRHDPVCAVWLIQSHTSEHWSLGQELRVFFEKSNQIVRITAFARDILLPGVELITRGGCQEKLIVAEVQRPPNNSLWTYSVESNIARRITTGHALNLSPDHSKAAFMKSEEAGFHCLYLWEIATGRIEPILSLWEQDPGSGISWECDWSDDSKVLKIAGDCSGFYRNKERGSKQFKYVFLASERKMFTAD